MTDLGTSTLTYLSAQALEACLSEQRENGLDPDSGELSAWHTLESDHISNLILSSPALYSHAAVESLLISRAYEADSPTAFLSSVIVVMSNAYRAGWHARGAVYDEPYFRELASHDAPAADAVEEWRRSIFEL